MSNDIQNTFDEARLKRIGLERIALYVRDHINYRPSLRTRLLTGTWLKTDWDFG